MTELKDKIEDYAKKSLEDLFRHPLSASVGAWRWIGDKIYADIKRRRKEVMDIYVCKLMLEDYQSMNIDNFTPGRISLLHTIYSEYAADCEDKCFDDCLKGEADPCVLAGIDFYLEEKVNEYVLGNDIFPYWNFVDPDEYSNVMTNGHNKVLVDLIYEYIRENGTSPEPTN